MRILAIRGRNLASLEAQFELDLVHGALGGAGVFAIVGSTGAGKSTLLDALCVALFDRTPRLGNHSRVQVSRGPDDPTALGAHDVRTLLRRGAASGWAEVDFEAGDGRRYRAHWAVRRARGHSDGAMQDASITLTDLDRDERLGGTKTETLKAIQAKLGLSFAQFKRSALLAQGEFAEFLRADGKDRSELLERMTGTEIYSRLSIAAHARAATAEARLRDLRAAVAAIALLAPDELVATASAQALAAAAALAARASLAASEHAARWLAETARHAHAIALAETSAADAGAAVAAAAPIHAELVLRRRAESLRPLFEASSRSSVAASRAAAELAASSALATSAHAHHRDLVDHRRTVESALAPVRAALVAIGHVTVPASVPVPVPVPVSVPVSASVSVSVSVSAPVSVPVSVPVPASVWVPVSATAVAAATAAATAASTVAATAWLVSHAALAPSLHTWPALDATFTQHASTTVTLARLDAELLSRSASHASLTSAVASAASATAAASSRLAAAQRTAADIQHARAHATSLDDAGRAEDAARRRCTDLDQLVAIAASARDAAATHTTLTSRRVELAAADTADDHTRTTVTAARTQAATLRIERTRVLDELRRVAGYAHARTELVDGEPCPLCGAPDHPWHGRGALDALIVDADAALADSIASVDVHTRELAALAARAAASDRERAAVEARMREVATATATSAARWRAALAGLGELALVEDPATPAAAALATERLAAANGQLERARDARGAATAIAKASEDAQAQVQARQLELDGCTAAQRARDAELATLDTELARLRGERAVRVAQRTELAADLDAAIARWLAAMPDAAHSVGAWRPAAADRDPAEVVAARAALAAIAVGWQRRVDAIAPIAATLDAALVALDAELRAGERAVAEHAARRDDGARRADQLAREAAVAAVALDAARVGLATDGAAIDANALATLLAAPPTRVAALTAELAALDRTLDLSLALIAERRRLAAEHAATQPPADALALADRVADLRAAVALADQHAAGLAATLAADDAARTRRATAATALATAEADAEVDRVLGAAIGSHDGKLFRSFAQSLTLDSLLAVANAHLEELAPRYQLQRVPRHDLELQVIDRDLGAEVRSVQSLSGGESFLVSLALALGLSSMSAHDVRVRTLLIDEGFGTLDPATLDAALAVLDALQSTGRQVGVISHVPALIERVGAHVRVIPRGGGRSDVIVGA